MSWSSPWPVYLVVPLCVRALPLQMLGINKMPFHFYLLFAAHAA